MDSLSSLFKSKSNIKARTCRTSGAGQNHSTTQREIQTTRLRLKQDLMTMGALPSIYDAFEQIFLANPRAGDGRYRHGGAQSHDFL
jgi:hypothetical protein